MITQDADMIRELLLRTEEQFTLIFSRDPLQYHSEEFQYACAAHLGFFKENQLTTDARDVLNLIRNSDIWNEAKRRIESSVGTTDWRTWMWTCRLVARETICKIPPIEPKRDE